MSNLPKLLSTLKELIHVRYTVTLDDDPLMARVIEETLGIKNFSFSESGPLLECAGHMNPVGAFVDIHLRGECGLDIIPKLRAIWPMTAIIVVSGDGSDDSIVQALASGADDFVKKPISAAEVVARLRARIEDLSDKNQLNLLKFGDFQVDLKHKVLSGPKCQLSLSAREVDLLAHLIRAQGTTVPKGVLKRQLWGSLRVSDNALDRKIFEVRKALREVSEAVELHSIYGVGMLLRMRSQVDDIQSLNRIESQIAGAQAEI